MCVRVRSCARLCAPFPLFFSSGTPVMRMLVHLMDPPFLWGSFHFFHYFSSLSWSMSVCLQVCLFFLLSVQICYWANLVRCFLNCLLLYFSTPEFPFGPFFIISICLLISSIWCSIVIIPYFISLIMVFFSSENMFIVVTLKSFSDKSNIWLLSQAVFVACFFQEYGLYFPVCFHSS